MDHPLANSFNLGFYVYMNQKILYVLSTNSIIFYGSCHFLHPPHLLLKCADLLIGYSCYQIRTVVQEQKDYQQIFPNDLF